MDLDMDWMENYDNFNNYDMPDDLHLRLRLPKRYIRDARNPFEWWSEEEFISRYRFRKGSIMYYILPRIEEPLLKASRRGLPIPPIKQLLVCLRFYATASFQMVCGDLEEISQASASNIVRNISNLLAGMHQTFIKFPVTREEIARNWNLYQNLGAQEGWDGIPRIDGAIDCTHIKIVNTPGQQFHEAFRNRKSFFSINVQAVAGPRGEFLNIVARWAGSTHDSRIFSMSRVNMRYMQRELEGALLGDNGYPSLPYLYTPVLNPQTVPQIRYNRAHVKARNVVERMFGIWKRRFSCLSRGMGNKLETVCNIIVACAVLHNISLILKDIFPLENENFPPELPIPIDPIQPEPGEGMAVRHILIQNHFT